MKPKRSRALLPRILAHPKDAREIFNYLFKKAQLWPEYKMSPRRGDIRRVVLFSEGFDDKTVDILEQIPNVTNLCHTIEEIRLVCTGITLDGAARLRRLLASSQVNVVTCEQWESKVETGNPDFDLKTGKLELPVDSRAKARTDFSSEIREKFLERFGPENLDKS